METKTKRCKNCQADFTIEIEDFEFYKKIDVPPPTFCPSCRLQRRLVWRNERSLYRRKCDVPGHTEMLISNYSSDVSNPVYDQKYWWSDEWDPLDYGKEYDPNRSFFEQFKELRDSVPVSNLTNVQCVDSDYCNFNYQSKNCYLTVSSNLCEDSAYLYHAQSCKQSFDNLGVNFNDNCYEAVHSHKCYRSAYIYFSTECIDSRFLYNCHNCQDCFGCVNLRNARYQIFNKQYTKEEYEKEMQKINLGSREEMQKIKEKFWQFSLGFPRRFAYLIKCVDSTGDYLSNTNNCNLCFDSEGPMEDCKYVIYGVPGTRDVYDAYGVGEGIERCYELTASGASLENAFLSPMVWTGHDIQYSHFCRGSSNIFGCVGLRDKQYCILNKQYDKKSFEKLKQEIIEQMKVKPYKDNQGREYRYGEFFAIDINPFCYNETLAQEFFPLTEAKAKQLGYRWKKSEKKEHSASLKTEDLPDTIKNVSNEILEEVIACKHNNECKHQCTSAFKLIPTELQFYQRMNIPVPDLCPNCRHYERLEKRNPLKLWKRKCQCGGESSEGNVYSNFSKKHPGHNSQSSCPNEFETTYAPDRKEIVYCEACYQAEVV